MHDIFPAKGGIYYRQEGKGGAVHAYVGDNYLRLDASSGLRRNSHMWSSSRSLSDMARNLCVCEYGSPPFLLGNNMGNEVGMRRVGGPGT